MAANSSEIDALVVQRIQDAAAKLGVATPGGSPARLSAIASAAAEYEQTYPRERVVEIAGSGGYDYEVKEANFPGFVVDWSDFLRIVYPYDVTAQELAGLGEEDYGLVRLPAAVYLRFTSARPSAAEKFLVWYTARHTVSASACTIPAAHDDGFVDLAASYCCEMLAALFAQATDGSFAADTVDHRTRTDQYRGLAKDLHKSAETKLGLGTPPRRAAVVFTDLNPPASMDRRARLLFHEAQ